MSSTPDRIPIHVDEELVPLIPQFLENRYQDIQTILSAIDLDDMETIRRLGHSMRGSGGGYGFEAITEIGGAIEGAARRRALNDIRKQIEALSDYLARIEIITGHPPR